MNASPRIQREMQMLDDLELNEVSARMIAAAYELSIRMNVTPRTVCDSAFCSFITDDQWRELRPALMQTLGRENGERSDPLDAR